MWGKLFVILFFFILSTMTCHANLNREDLSKCLPIIMENIDTLVNKIDQDKIYLNKERILLTEKGLFLELEGRNYLEVPYIFFDGLGYFIKTTYDAYTCLTCGEPLGWNGRCQNIDCPRFGKIGPVHHLSY